MRLEEIIDKLTIRLTQANDHSKDYRISDNTLQVVNDLEKEINELGGKLSDVLRLPLLESGNQTIVEFPNGYVISFVESDMSYGLEAAILKIKSRDDWDLCYTTWITDDVLRYLDEEDILPLVKDVSELEPVKKIKFIHA